MKPHIYAFLTLVVYRTMYLASFIFFCLGDQRTKPQFLCLFSNSGRLYLYNFGEDGEKPYIYAFETLVVYGILDLAAFVLP